MRIDMNYDLATMPGKVERKLRNPMQVVVRQNDKSDMICQVHSHPPADISPHSSSDRQSW